MLKICVGQEYWTLLTHELLVALILAVCGASVAAAPKLRVCGNWMSHAKSLPINDLLRCLNFGGTVGGGATSSDAKGLTGKNSVAAGTRGKYTRGSIS